MSWRYVDPLLEKLSKHSTIIGKYWVCIVVIFRLTMLAFADRVWSDEQKEFKCNTKEIGCDNVCFNRFAPLSNVRLWGLQLLAICIPVSLYLVYIWHLVSRAQHDQDDQKQKNRAMKAIAAQQLNKLRMEANKNKGTPAKNTGTNTKNMQELDNVNSTPRKSGKGGKAEEGICAGGDSDNGNNSCNKNLKRHLAPENLPQQYYIQAFNTNQNNNIITQTQQETHSNNNNNTPHPQQGIADVQSYPANNYVKAWISSIQDADQNLPSHMVQAKNHDPQLYYRGKKKLSSDNVAKVPMPQMPMDAADAPIEGVLPYVDMKRLNKKLKKQEQYERFNRTILPNDWRNEAKKRPRNERNIWRFYIVQLLLRTSLDVFFTYLQWSIYPFRYIVPEVYICGGDVPGKSAPPCPHKVDCFVSRPMEKTVFFLYFYIVAGVCLVVNVAEMWYIGFYRLRHAFSPVKTEQGTDQAADFEDILNKAAGHNNNVNPVYPAKAIPQQVQPAIPPPQYQHPPPPVAQMAVQMPAQPSSRSHTIPMNRMDQPPLPTLTNITPESRIAPKRATMPANNVSNRATSTIHSLTKPVMATTPAELLANVPGPNQQGGEFAYPTGSIYPPLDARQIGVQYDDDIYDDNQPGTDPRLHHKSMYDTALGPDPSPAAGVAGIHDNCSERSGPLQAIRREHSSRLQPGYSRRPKLFRNSTRKPTFHNNRAGGGISDED